MKPWMALVIVGALWALAMTLDARDAQDFTSARCPDPMQGKALVGITINPDKVVVCHYAFSTYGKAITPQKGTL